MRKLGRKGKRKRKKREGKGRNFSGNRRCDILTDERNVVKEGGMKKVKEESGAGP